MKCKDTHGNNQVKKDQVIIKTRYGMLEGCVDQRSGTLSWLGVPYAHPPIGDLRWRAPRDPEPWNAVYKAKNYAQKCIQKSAQGIIGSEDCLYLNIWRPNSDLCGLPVLVWVHGGGNMLGSGEDFPGDILAAKTNSVIISVNYRLGILGWFRLPVEMSTVNCTRSNNGLECNNGSACNNEPSYNTESKCNKDLNFSKLDLSGNYGLLDIIKSLEWVRDDILNFGGDPDNITLGGHSGGARNALALLISPLAKGLFNKALIVSGGRTLADPEQGDQFSKHILNQLLIKDSLVSDDESAQKWCELQSAESIAAYLKNKNPEVFLDFLGPVEIRMADFPHLFADGHVIPEEGFNKLYAGDYAKVPIILGSDETEYGIYNILDAYWSGSVLDLSIINDPEHLDLYLKALDYGSRLFACCNAESTADVLASSQTEPVFVYRLTWGVEEGTLSEPLRTLAGASHQVDLDFITGYEKYVLNSMFPGLCYSEHNKPGREKLTECMMGCIGSFLQYGNPNHDEIPRWYSWQENNRPRVLRLGADADDLSALASDEYYSNQQILEEMRNSLKSNEIKVILDVLFKGRFFMEY